MITQEQIRKRLITAVNQSGLTQAELADKVGIVQQSVAQYISGRAMPTLATFANLCEVLGANANYILCLTDWE